MMTPTGRPYLFSNTVAPAICAASIQTIELLTASTELRDRVHENTAYFREKQIFQSYFSSVTAAVRGPFPP